MITVDKKCPECGKIKEDRFKDELVLCDDCQVEMDRVFGMRKLSEFQPGFYNNFGDSPIYIENRRQFADECEKRGLFQKGGRGCYDARFSKKKHHVYSERSKPPVKPTHGQLDQRREKAIAEACNKLGVE